MSAVVHPCTACRPRQQCSLQDKEPAGSSATCKPAWSMHAPAPQKATDNTHKCAVPYYARAHTDAARCCCLVPNPSRRLQTHRGKEPPTTISTSDTTPCEVAGGAAGTAQSGSYRGAACHSGYPLAVQFCPAQPRQPAQTALTHIQCKLHHRLVTGQPWDTGQRKSNQFSAASMPR